MLILIRFTSTILGSFFHGALYLGTQDANSQWEGMAGEDGGERGGGGASQGLQSEQKAGFAIHAEALGQLSVWPNGGGGQWISDLWTEN